MAVFVRAVETGSFAAAATQLGLSAPMIGKHVRALEDRLGAGLINRTTRRQNLTEFGRAYYERCRLVLAEAEAADRLAGELRGVPRGRLRVSLPVLLGRRCAAPLLLGLAARHPELELALSFSDRPVDLIEDDFDLAIRNGQVAEGAGLMVRRLAGQTMILCAAPAYLAAHGTPTGLEDLAGHQGILYGRSGRTRPWLFPEAGGAVLEVTPRHRLRLDDLEAIADAAVAGMGLAWLPGWLIAETVRSGALARLLPERPGMTYGIHALWLRAPHMPLRLRLAIDALAAGLPGMLE